jgi:hypothetical protein
MAKPGPYTAGARAPAALQGQTFPSYYAYQNARAQNAGYKSYAAQRVVEGVRSNDPVYKTFERRATFEGKSKRWARETYRNRQKQVKHKLNQQDSRQLQVDEGLADSIGDTWYH